MGLPAVVLHHDADVGDLDDAAFDVVELHGVADLIAKAHVVGGKHVIDHILRAQAEGQRQPAEDRAQDDGDDDDQEGDIDAHLIDAHHHGGGEDQDLHRLTQQVGVGDVGGGGGGGDQILYHQAEDETGEQDEDPGDDGGEVFHDVAQPVGKHPHPQDLGRGG